MIDFINKKIYIQPDDHKYYKGDTVHDLLLTPFAEDHPTFQIIIEQT